jgi:hypothetical protein
VALLMVVAYLVITAMRLPLRQHRWAYWWFARAAATVLTMTAFIQLQRDAGTVVIGDEVVRPAVVLVTVLALQQCLPLVAAARRRTPRGIAADAAAVILVQLAATALSRRPIPQDGSTRPPRHLRPWAALRHATSSAVRQVPSGWRRSRSAHCWPSVTAAS